MWLLRPSALGNPTCTFTSTRVSGLQRGRLKLDTSPPPPPASGWVGPVDHGPRVGGWVKI